MFEKHQQQDIKTESGAIKYVLALIMFVLTSLFLSFFIIDANMRIVESDLEQGLHIAESAALVCNYPKVFLNENIPDLLGARLHVINDFENTDFYFPEEITEDAARLQYFKEKLPTEDMQLRNVSNVLLTSLKEQWNLVDGNGTIPKDNTLASLTASSPIYLQEIIIYEPNYTKNVISDVDDSGIPKFIINYTKDSSYVKYTMRFADNNLISIAKNTCINPKLKNGMNIEGATIEATVSLQLKGLLAFAKQSSNPLVGGKTSSIDSSFGTISVTQAVDIIPANLDSRNPNN